MVNVREVRMLVLQLFMPMCVCVWLYPIPVTVMGVFVVLVMSVAMTMGHFGVLMVMGVMFGKVQPHAYRHQRRRDSSAACQRHEHSGIDRCDHSVVRW